ncbi:SpoIIE family protein phosphatase [Marinactinospora thermotolerans]|uniref:protein-serine/threonine phosphatase n=1 Tax=Marinactinospora thermotolerans DSM 45154 TaxID=1122192 RepID=A0A1T4PVQ4_9ACTN|nr:SpoIIE family protein phosphatase [Marinactinospora thermotolerans]SJZ95008.1 PAS domain S-box-containing protein [Marinactinospora thermotolerans DSM 45154]
MGGDQTGGGPLPPVDAHLLSVLFTELGAGVYVVDAAGKIIACNPWAERHLGYPPGALLGKDAHRLLNPLPGGDHGLPEQRPILEELADGHGVSGDRAVLLRSDGTTSAVWWTATPLPSGGGAVVLFHDDAARRDWEEQRAHRYAHSEALRERAESDLAETSWLGELTVALSSTLDAEEGLRRLVRLLVPRIADAALVDLAASAGRLHRVAWAHRAPDRVPAGALEDDLPRHGPVSKAVVAQVLAGGPTRHLAAPFVPPPDADALERATAAMLTGLGAGQALVVPLRTRLATLGTLTLTRAPGERPFDEADLSLAEEIARRATLGLDNARLHAGQADIAATLQRALLTDLPAHPGLELSAHYRPASHAAEVGGDWYDAFPLPGGDLALIIGDVTGHDIQAASRMSELRSMLRALAVDRPHDDPGTILRRLDRAQDHLALADSATAVFARLRPAAEGAWRLSWSVAGHPPPLLVSGNGRARHLSGGHAPLLGALPEAPRPTAEMVLAPGSTLLLYTDGLVESRVQDLDTGMTRLRGYAALHHEWPLDELCAGLAGELGDPRDDITLIAVRIPAS